MAIAFGVVCLLLGGLLVGVQAKMGLRHKTLSTTAAKISEAAAKVAEAAAKSSDAATKARIASDAVRAAHQAVATGTAEPPGIADAAGAATDATQSSASANTSAQEAKDSADSLTGLLGDLSGSMPYAVLGLLFVLAGAWINGLISISLGAAGK